METEVLRIASAVPPAEIRYRIGRQTLGATRLNEEIDSKGEPAIGCRVIGRNKPQVASAWILEDASSPGSVTELPATATPATVRAEEAEIESGTAAFRIVAVLEIPAPLAVAVAAA